MRVGGPLLFHMKHRLHIHIEESAISQLHEISRATGRSTAHWIRQAVDDLVVKMVEFGVVASSAPLRGQRRKPWEREIKEELLARKELGEKLGRRDIRFYCD